MDFGMLRPTTAEDVEQHGQVAELSLQRPVLARCCADSDLRFNVSHSNDVAVYAFSFGREIGVDLEAVRAVPDRDECLALDKSGVV